MLNGQATRNTHMCTHEPVEIKGFVTEKAISKSQTTKWHPQHQLWALSEFLLGEPEPLARPGPGVDSLVKMKLHTKRASAVKLSPSMCSQDTPLSPRLRKGSPG